MDQNREILADKIKTYYDMCVEIEKLENAISAETDETRKTELFSILTSLIVTRAEFRKELPPRPRHRQREVVCAIL